MGQQGGVTVSDSLGVRALRRFYDPSEENFNSRRIAQEAFLAGNDVLLLSQFRQKGHRATQVETVESTIRFFQEKYDSEPAFQALVDAAVARILKLKLKLYNGQFSLAQLQSQMSQMFMASLERGMSSLIWRDP